MRYCEGCGTEIGARKRYCEHCRDEAYKRQAKKRYVQHGYYKRRYDNGITYICQCCGDKVHVMSRVRRSYCDRCLEAGKLGKLSHQYLMQRMPFQETHEGESDAG